MQVIVKKGPTVSQPHEGNGRFIEGERQRLLPAPPPGQRPGLGVTGRLTVIDLPNMPASAPINMPSRVSYRRVSPLNGWRSQHIVLYTGFASLRAGKGASE